MPKVAFTSNLDRHVETRPGAVPGETVRQVLDAVFAGNPRLESYVLDDQRRLRKHVTVFVDGKAVSDRDGLSDSVSENAEVYLFQLLSGG